MTRIKGRTKVARPRASRAHRRHRDGLDLARHLPQRCPRLPVIVTTGYSNRKDQLATLEAVVLAKPIAPSAPLAAIASLGIGTSIN